MGRRPDRLTATLTRFSLLDDAKTVTQRLCGVAAAPARPVRDRDPRYERARVAKCVIDAQLEHGSVEAATYSGEIAYPWEGGTRTVGFSVLCISGLGHRCSGLP